MGYDRQEKARRVEDAERVLANHVMVPDEVRSFRFKNSDPKKGSFYWFTLTWTPGHLTLAGDCGDLTLVHYHALRRFSDISWALSTDFSYLLEKTNVKREYDPGATRRFVKEEFNRGVIELRKAERDELREHRKDPEEDYDPRQFRMRRKAGAEEISRTRFNPTIEDIWEIPDGWELWVKAWLHHHGWFSPASTFQPTEVENRKERAIVWRTISEELSDARSAADVLHKFGFDDYYGSYSYESHRLFQIAVIQHGVRMILGEESKDATRQEDAGTETGNHQERTGAEPALS